MITFRILSVCLFLSFLFPALCIGQSASGMSQIVIDSRTTDGVFINPPDSAHVDQYQKLDKRLEILERSRDDIGSWIKIFLTSVSVLIALNIGISVWQVGSIARKEVSLNIDQLHKEIEALLQESEKGFDAKISEFQNSLTLAVSKVESLEKQAAQTVEQNDNRVSELKNELNDMINRFRAEAEKTKVSAEAALENWYARKVEGA